MPDLPASDRLNDLVAQALNVSLQHIDGVTFDEAWDHRIEGLIDGEIQAAVISRSDLIRNKLATGREQDILDVKKLRSQE